MRKLLLASLILVSVISVDAFAKSGMGRGKGKGPGPGKPTFTNGCLVIEDDAKGPMADAAKNADADSDGCVTEAELKTYMESHKPAGKPEGKGPRRGKKASSETEE